MSLTARTESFLQEHLWGPMQQPQFVAHRLQSANHCVQQWFAVSWQSTAQFVEDVRKDPPIYRNPNNANEILVRLPPWFLLVKDPVTLDVVCFAASAIAFRIYLFWRGWAAQRRRWRRTLDDDDYDGGVGGGAVYDNRRRRLRPSPPVVVKATKVVGFEDASLRQTMKECQHVKQKLRKVQDPEQKRRERQKQFKYNNKQGSSGGFLGMSQDTLQRARNDLKQVTGSNNYNNNYNYYNQANRWPLSTKENNRM